MKRLLAMSDTITTKIHDRTLEVLYEVGLMWPDEPSLKDLAKRGLRVDHARQTVRMFPAQVEAALEQAPRDVTLYPRDQGERLSYDRGPLLMGAGTGVAVIDIETLKRRPSTSRDVAQLVCLQDALPNVDIVRPIVTMNDAPPQHSGLLEYALALCHTGKHVHHRVLHPGDVELLVEIGVIVTGCAQRLRERPILTGLYCPLSPLAYTAVNVKCMLEYAKHGIPFQVLSQTIMGASAPPTMLGPVIVTNAEILGTITIMQNLFPGTGVMYGGLLSPMDMRSGLVTYGTPEMGILLAMAGQMARHYGFVSILAGLRTDAKQCDEQAGFEKAINLWPILPVADIVYGAGNLDTGLTCGYDQLVLDDELMSAARRQLWWKPEGDGQLELDLLKEVGVRGNFLASHRTVQAARSSWYPQFFARGDYETWAIERADAGKLAQRKAREILAEHAPPSLPAEMLAEIRHIVERRTDKDFAASAFR
jgi:trimethylamine--corrinoid protein Co-methyltransferase